MANISPDISFLASYVRGQHAKLLSISDFEGLINKPYEVFINDLKSFEIGHILRQNPSYQSHEIERFLTTRLLDQYSFILKNTPVWARNFIESYTVKFEVMNLQRIARYLYSNAEINMREAINLRSQEMLGRTAFIAKMLRCNDLAELLETLKQTEYAAEIEVAENIYSNVGDIWPIEFAFDTYYLKQMLAEASKLRRKYKDGALTFVHQEILTNLLLVILKADFVEVDVSDALKLLPLPDNIPFKRQLSSLISEPSLKTDLEILKSFNSEKINQGIKWYKEDQMFLHIEIAIRARGLAALKKSFYEDYGILSVLSYLKQYETQIQDLNKLLYLKEYKFPIEKTRELIINLL
ncbi:MAG: V-type ATPase subunit [Candidatus Heimdallarchaeota archaeon]|nr:V-type ATPase subunit [Candidatus Heimdallarchaeota archaeon]